MRVRSRSRSTFRLSITRIAVGLFLGGGGLLGVGVARAGDYSKIYAEGLRHSRKAAGLAGANNCRAAVPEYSKAFRLLKDPVVLFNRAECYRTLGNSEAALADYRRFLVELPTAPNRLAVEGQIAALEAATTASAGAGAAVVPRPVPRPVPAPPPTPVPPPSIGNGGAPIIADPPPATEPPEVAPKSPPRSTLDPGDDIGTRLNPRPRPTAPDLVPVDSVTLPLGSGDDRARPSITRRWWFWTTLAVVVAGAGVATYLAIQAGKTEIPSSGLGNYRF